METQSIQAARKTSTVAIRQVSAANSAALTGSGGGSGGIQARLYTTNPVRTSMSTAGSSGGGRMLSDGASTDSSGGSKKGDRKHSSSRKISTLKDAAGYASQPKIFGSICVRPNTREKQGPGRRFSYFSFWDGQVPRPMRFGGIDERTPSKSSEAKRQTFQLEPNQEARFNVDRVEKVLEDILEKRLTESKYDPRASAFAAQHLCETIKERVKEMNLDRYKVVVKVVIGSVSGDLLMASRCLWSDFDNFASSTFRNSSLFAIALVYGIYFD